MAHPVLAPLDFEQGFVVAIEIVAHPGEEEAVAEGLLALVEPTMAEPGVTLFAPYRSPTDPHAFFVFELYHDEAGWAAHQKTTHFQAFVEHILPRLAHRKRVPFVPSGRAAID